MTDEPYRDNTSPPARSSRGIDPRWLRELEELRQGWDTYDGRPITEAALTTAKALSAVPMSSGGIQIDVHASGAEVEVEIGPDGQITSVFWERA